MTTQSQYRYWNEARDNCLEVLGELQRLYKIADWTPEEDAWVDNAKEVLEKLQGAIKG